MHTFKIGARNINEHTFEFLRNIMRGRIQKLTLQMSSSSKGLQNAVIIFEETEINHLYSYDETLSNVGKYVCCINHKQKNNTNFRISIQKLVTLCKVQQLLMMVKNSNIDDPGNISLICKYFKYFQRHSLKMYRHLCVLYGSISFLETTSVY